MSTYTARDLETSQQRLGPVGWNTGDKPIVAYHPDDFKGWELRWTESRKKDVLIVVIEGWHRGRIHHIRCFCSTDIFRVAKETHIFA